ncbi:TPA: hypothetical protein N0F65_003801 [Lagenidium giganteum]|uniref:Uncharacterized protein n=1 Tax=Lagenidium giganteum TaxID=4803 RepID=A0AAV2YX64_9STRA|nr:TPA: hypothetical protein N0F65_003801 [Lagenidium giganteum]
MPVPRHPVSRQTCGCVGPAKKADIKAIMASLVYAKVESDYLVSRHILLRMCGNNKEHNLFFYFVKSWDSDLEPWAAYLRGTVPHLGNNTNNRYASMPRCVILHQLTPNLSEQPYGHMDDCIKTLFVLLQDC